MQSLKTEKLGSERRNIYIKNTKTQYRRYSTVRKNLMNVTPSPNRSIAG